MKLTHIALVAATAFFASSLAFAADEPPKFDAADANGDGVVDASEFEATKIERDFGEIDEDGDGKLNQDEYAAALEEDCA